MTACPTCGRGGSVITIGKLTVYPNNFAQWNRRAIRASAGQFAIIAALVRAAPDTVSAGRLMVEMASAADECNTLRVQVCNLRRALRAAGAPDGLIATVRGSGYRLNTEVVA